jgi:hypothetical protein
MYCVERKMVGTKKKYRFTCNCPENTHPIWQTAGTTKRPQWRTFATGMDVEIFKSYIKRYVRVLFSVNNTLDLGKE